VADTTRKKPIDAEDVPAPAASAVDDKPSESANAAKPARQTAAPAADAAEEKPEENPTADPKTEASVEKTEGKADSSVNKTAEPAPAADVAPEDEKKVATGAVGSDGADADADADAGVAPAKDAPADVAPADEGESIEQRLAEAEARAAEAERKLAVAQVGFELGLPPELASRLQGTTEAEIKKDANALMDAIAKFKAAQPAEDDQDDAEEETPLDRNGRVPSRPRKSNADSDTMDAIGARMFRR